MTFWGSNTLNARGFGITGGASFLGIRNLSPELTTGYHAGLTYQIDLPFGFAIQPSVLYHVKGHLLYQSQGSLAEAPIFDQEVYDAYKTGYVEVPVSLQWGPDLILFRPFLDVTPFVGYGVQYNRSWEGYQRLEYGLGTGVGLEFWRIQLVGRYNWNFGPLYSADRDDHNFGGVTLSLTFKI